MSFLPRSGVSTAVALAVACLTFAGEAWAEGDADDFKANCANCHTIGGGRLVGPDLKDVTKRQKRDWLTRFVQDPQGVIASGDPYARKLLAEHNNVMMAPVAGMTAKRADALLTLIEAESKLEKSRFATSGVSDRPFTPLDLALGRDIFLGRRRRAGGGPACLGCHQIGGDGALGGGRLGPDLSDAFGRLGGRKALGAWLVAPPLPTMKPIFSAHPLDPEREVLPILAFMKDASDRHEVPDRTSQRVAFLLAAGAAAAVLLLAADLAWKRRFREVRAAVVRDATGGRA
jgi:cytochrome c2